MLDGGSSELTEDWLSFNKCLWFLKLVYLFKTVLNYTPSTVVTLGTRERENLLSLFHFRRSLCVKIGRIIGTHLCACACACVCVCVCVCEEYILKSCTYVCNVLSKECFPLCYLSYEYKSL
jgi:hypothetical protein